ncbi:polyprenol monophosphomannose synthase [Egicoccus halophilus]|uniref:Dolichol-phosphate mannosyltransferase n=1 Tax=Egicoccus halophilus TaxID=1670830 RepID=A0A8J3ERC3_9ACTN|nr:polyprenol monophosphomannose synthase [Egicoccus halophilus]GGI04721.1 dolichol-phosphate mannosyltransferase [Egicoccus halophilus]
MRALVVVPTYDERGTVEELVTALRALPSPPDVLVVDDASPDGTGQVADALAGADPGVSVLHRPAKGGLGPAYRAGLRWGLDRGYVALVEMDADLSHDPADVPRLLAGLDRADLVIGSRYVSGGDVRQWAAARVALSTAGNRYVRALTRLPVRDATSGFRAFRAAVLRTIAIDGLTSDGYAFQVETALRAWRAGFVLHEVPITFVERREGASKLSRRVVAEAAWRVPAWGLAAPLGSRPRRAHPASVVRQDPDAASPSAPSTR